MIAVAICGSMTAIYTEYLTGPREPSPAGDV